MVAPYSTVGGYGGNPSLAYDPNTGVSAGQVDTQDGYPTLHPALLPGGGLTPYVVDPTASPPNPNFWQAMPEINAMLVELRVISALLREQMGDTAKSFDLQIMRADEAWNTNQVTGVL